MANTKIQSNQEWGTGSSQWNDLASDIQFGNTVYIGDESVAPGVPGWVSILPNQGLYNKDGNAIAAYILADDSYYFAGETLYADIGTSTFASSLNNFNLSNSRFLYEANKDATGQDYFHVGETNPLTWIENYRGDFISDLVGYAGYSFHNLNADSTSSIDFIFNNDVTTETTHYVDFGFNSSTFDDVTYPAWNQPDRAYYYNTDQGISFGGFFNGVSSAAEITQTFTSTEVNTGTEEITVTSANNLYNGARVVLTTSGSAPGGLTAGTTYFVINTNTDGIGGTVIKLATTLANALTGTAINLTSGGSGTHTLTLESSLFDFMGNGQGREKVYFSIMKDGDIVARNVNNGVVYGLDAKSDSSLAVAIGIGVNASAVSAGAFGANFTNSTTNTLALGWGTRALEITSTGAITTTQGSNSVSFQSTNTRGSGTNVGIQGLSTGNGSSGIAGRFYVTGSPTNRAGIVIGNTTPSGSFDIYADGGYDNYLSGRLGVAQTSPTAVVDVGASTTARSSLRIRSGTAPTSPNDGDIWFDGTDLKIRISGATKTVTVT